MKLEEAMSQSWKVRCADCQGRGKVAILCARPGDPLTEAFPELVNRPMVVSLERARELLRDFNKRRNGLRLPFNFRDSRIRAMADRLQTVECPTCRGTGISHTLVFNEPKG